MERKSEEFCRSSLCQPIGLLHSCYNNIIPHVLWNRRIPSRKYMYPIYCCAEPLKLFTNTCKILPFFCTLKQTIVFTVICSASNVKRESRHSSSFSLVCPDFKNGFFEKILRSPRSKDHRGS